MERAGGWERVSNGATRNAGRQGGRQRVAWRLGRWEQPAVGTHLRLDAGVLRRPCDAEFSAGSHGGGGTTARSGGSTTARRCWGLLR